jgi:carbon storage regulator
MLVLSRRPGEKICIGGNIWVTVVAVKGSCVRVGIEAPTDVIVDRSEIHTRRQSTPIGLLTSTEQK